MQDLTAKSLAETYVYISNVQQLNQVTCYDRLLGVNQFKQRSFPRSVYVSTCFFIRKWISTDVLLQW